MTEKIYIISDTELGRKDVMDAFSSDDFFVNFIESIHSKNKNEKATLVINGDIFEFLKMAYKDTYPRYINEGISLWKMNEVVFHHPKFFSSLKKFLQNPNHEVHFVIGNHDADLAWPALQSKIREAVDNADRIHFGFWFNKKEVHAEHGHLVDPFFTINTSKPTIHYKGEEILNTPFGTQICFHHLVNIKRQFPEEEQWFPKDMVLHQNPGLKKEKKKTLHRLLFQEMFINPLLHIGDPTYQVPYFKLLDHFLHFGTDVLDDARFLPLAIKRLIKKHPGKPLYVLGHAHVLGEHTYKNHRVLVTDTWRDEFDISRNMAKKPKTVAKIILEAEKIAEAGLETLSS